MLPLLFLGCSPAPSVEPPKDAGTVMPEEDATPPEDAGAPIACTPSASCGIARDRECDGGFVYGCAEGRCPTVAGSCRVLSDNTVTGYAEACCEKLACVRMQLPNNFTCQHEDAGGAGNPLLVLYDCPDGTEKPQGTCARQFPGAWSWCCKD